MTETVEKLQLLKNCFCNNFEWRGAHVMVKLISKEKFSEHSENAHVKKFLLWYHDAVSKIIHSQK